ncbi:MAG: S41 family peptidase [Lachnospiraceae bacterium]|nr:S41 family peptidase [Lachnospiraceae bacterium]MDY5742258.1 S41 family peptidase [Lachnospiraceae bacterium]
MDKKKVQMTKGGLAGLLIGVVLVTALIFGSSGVLAGMVIAKNRQITVWDRQNMWTDSDEAKQEAFPEDANGMTESAEELVDEQALDKIKGLTDTIHQEYLNEGEADNTKLREGLYKGLVSGLGDIYSEYYTPEEYQKMQESISGKYSGIGALLNQDRTTKAISITKVFAGSPAEEVGIKAGDVIDKVNGESVATWTLTELVSKVKGEEGSTVDLKIYRNGEAQDFTVTRKQINVPTVSYEVLDNKVGYLQITEFDQVTIEQVKAALEDLDKQGAASLVVDLRDNPGGLLNGVVDILGYFIEKDKMVYTIDKNGKEEDYYPSTKQIWTKPMNVLINGNSASAAEIFAAAVRDYDRGKLIGTKTYGKGIVQNTFPFNDGSAVKLTISKFYTPKGENFHGVGVEPHEKVEIDKKAMEDNKLERSEDSQLEKAIELLK